MSMEAISKDMEMRSNHGFNGKGVEEYEHGEEMDDLFSRWRMKDVEDIHLKEMMKIAMDGKL